MTAQRPVPFLFMLCLLACPGFLAAEGLAFRPIGLPASTSTMPIFSRYPGMLPLDSSIPVRDEWFFLPQVALSQGMTNAWVGVAPKEKIVSLFDYESLSLEVPVLAGLGGGWSLGGNLRLAWLSGGFLDPLIETFHGWFSLPNNARDKLPRNRILVDLDTHNGPGFHLDHSVFMLADPVLMLGFSPWRSPELGLSLLTQLSLPLGLGQGITGSSLPVVAWGAFADWWPFWWLGVHGAAGLVLPCEVFRVPGPLAMFQARLAAIFNPGWDVLPYVQFTLQTSPVRTDFYDGPTDYFSLPNTDLYFGVIFAGPAARKAGAYGAFTVQEDPFTHNAADVGFMASGAFTLGK